MGHPYRQRHTNTEPTKTSTNTGNVKQTAPKPTTKATKTSK